MRIRELLVGTAVMLFATTIEASPPLGFFDELNFDTNSKNSRAANSDFEVSTMPSRLIGEDKIFASAYYDVLDILSGNNRCSDFYGGPVKAVSVFDRLIAGVRKEHLSTAIGMRMSGETTNVSDAGSDLKYRVFEKVSINANGPFYRKRSSATEPLVPRIGTFEPNTREARVLILLHELGHVVKSPNGDWALPNDGDDEAQSRRNTQKVEDVCSEQIQDLSKSQPILNLAAKRKRDHEVALAKSTQTSNP